MAGPALREHPGPCELSCPHSGFLQGPLPLFTPLHLLAAIPPPPWGIRLSSSLRQGQWIPTTDERALCNFPGLGGFLYRELFEEMCFLVGNVKWCSHFRKV